MCLVENQLSFPTNVCVQLTTAGVLHRCVPNRILLYFNLVVLVHEYVKMEGTTHWTGSGTDVLVYVWCVVCDILSTDA